MMNTFILHKARLRKFPLALAAFLDLLAGGFACCVGADPLMPFLSYALGIAALYMEKFWALAALTSLALSVYGVVMLRGELVPLLVVAAIFKCASPFLKGWLVLKSEVRVLAGVVGYLRENPQVLFVFPFMVLLVLAAVKLASGDSVMADRLAVYAYYQLMGGMLTALILTFRKSGYSSRS